MRIPSTARAAPIPRSAGVAWTQWWSSMSPSCFPPAGPDRRPLPSAGSSWGEFPGFNGTMGRSDSLLPFPSDSVVLRPTVPTPCACVRLSLRPDADRGPGALGCGRPAPPWRGVTGSLTFLGNPSASMPGSQTPARPLLQAIAKDRHGPRSGKTEDSPPRHPFGAQRQASTLAVFASQLGLLRDHARLASGRGPRSTGWDSTPTGFLRKVSPCPPLHRSSFPRLLVTQCHAMPRRDFRFRLSSRTPRH